MNTVVSILLMFIVYMLIGIGLFNVLKFYSKYEKDKLILAVSSFIFGLFVATIISVITIIV